MVSIPINEKCSICNNLGYPLWNAKRSHDDLRRLRPTRLAGRSLDQFQTSGMQGCFFCRVISEAFAQLLAEAREVDLLIYQDSPAELHSLSSKSDDVVEIYAISGKPATCGILPECIAKYFKRHSVDTNHGYPRLGNDVTKESSLEASKTFLQEQYNKCKSSHKECHQGEKFFPKRVVDVSETRYRLVELPTGTEGVYATLSYSWGNRGFAMATSENYEELKHGFDRESLPILFQDAAAIARSLNIDYLWIDTLCIIQDCLEDWAEQAAKMAEIFQGAAITIAASSSPDPYRSLFTTRVPRHQEIELNSKNKGKRGLHSEATGELVDVVFKARKKITRGIHAKIGRSTDTDPLDTRAWGLQERMLSTRLIAFTGAELQWTCRKLKACECHQNPYSSHILFPVLTETVSMEKTREPEKIRGHSKIWSQVIEEYSARKLTFSTDRLPALSGLASKFEDVTGFTYIAGLWKESLLYDFVWQCDIKPLPSPSTKLGPSFSWVSAPGAVNFRFARHSYPGIRRPHTTLLEYSYRTIRQGDTYGRADYGSLTIQGPMVAAHLRRSSKSLEAYAICIDNAVYSENTDQRAICEFSIDKPMTQYNEDITSEASKLISYSTPFDDTDQQVDKPVTLLSLYSIHHQKYLYQNFLILVREREKRHGIETYQRIGVGSGKMYSCEDDIPSEPGLVGPFEWLSVDLKKSGHSIGNIAKHNIRII